MSLVFPDAFSSVPYSVTALTDTVISPIPHTRIVALFEASPELAAEIFWSFACEAAIYTERLTDIGRRSALERVAHFLLELHARLEIIGLADEHSYPMPFTQELIGDALGLSVPHVNRTLRQLRNDDLLVIEHQHVVIKDIEALSALAGFDRKYLSRFRIPEMFKSAAEPSWPPGDPARLVEQSRPASDNGRDTSRPSVHAGAGMAEP